MNLLVPGPVLEKRRIDSLRVQIWYCVLCIAGEFDNANQVSKFLSKRTSRKSRSSLAYKYEKGERIPHPDILEYVTGKYPGTKYWLELPMWQLFWDDDYDQGSVDTQLKNLRPSVTSLIFDVPADNLYASIERKPFSYHKVCKLLLKYSDLNSFTGALCLYRDCELNNLTIQKIIVSQFIWAIFYGLVAFRPFCYFSDRLFEFMATRFPCNVDLNNQEIIPRQKLFELFCVNILVRNKILKLLSDLSLIDRSNWSESQKPIIAINHMSDLEVFKLGLEIRNGTKDLGPRFNQLCETCNIKFTPPDS